MVKRNHFVSRGYLKFFLDNDDNVVHVYDKLEKRKFKSCVANVCLETNLYNCLDGKEEKSWEDFYCHFDRIAPVIIRNIVSLCTLTNTFRIFNGNSLKNELASIISIQMLRIPKLIFSLKSEYNENLSKIIDELKNVKYLEEKNRKIKQYSTDEHYKSIVLETINSEKFLSKMINCLLDKTWLICKINTKAKFITSDNPVVVYNFDKNCLDSGIMRNDVVILYPLTPQYIVEILPINHLPGLSDIEYGDRFVLLNDIDIINKFNKLQYENAERFIISNERINL